MPDILHTAATIAGDIPGGQAIAGALEIASALGAGDWLNKHILGDASGQTAAAVIAAAGTSNPAALASIPPTDRGQIMIKLAEIAAAREQSLEAAKLDTLKTLITSDAGQTEINKLDAASESWFQRCWRPAAGWVCVISLALYYWPMFIIGSFLWARMSIALGAIQPRPDMGVLDLLGLLGSLAGFGAVRSWEKSNGLISTVVTKVAGK